MVDDLTHFRVSMKIMHLGTAKDCHSSDVGSLVPQAVKNRLLDILLHARHPETQSRVRQNLKYQL